MAAFEVITEALTEQKLGEWLSQPLDVLDLKIVLVDGIHFRDHCILVALGVDSDGKKHPLGIREGDTENAAVAKALLADLVERGLPSDRALVFVCVFRTNVNSDFARS